MAWESDRAGLPRTLIDRKGPIMKIHDRVTTRNISTLLRAGAALAGLLLSAAVLAGNGSDPLAPYEEDGPYTTTRIQAVLAVPFTALATWVATTLIIWGNGTGGTLTTYGSGLEHWASWGFVWRRPTPAMPAPAMKCSIG